MNSEFPSEHAAKGRNACLLMIMIRVNEECSALCSQVSFLHILFH
jgi:hypothetical protein